MEEYKIFNGGLKNRYGVEFEVGKAYTLDISNRDIEYGINGYGFHFVKRPEDALRYFDAINGDVDIACVESLGPIKEYYDDYYGYYDLYVTNSILIKHALTRKEFIIYMLNTNENRIERLIQGFQLNEEELKIILEKYPTDKIYRAIEYYQRGNKDIYSSVKAINLRR